MADYLITGCGGFVSWHYLQHLAQIGFQGQIVGIGTTAPTGVPESLRFRFEETNLLDSEKLSALLSRVRPQFCIHLAAMSSVAGSWVQPDKSFVNNTNIFLNLVEAIRKCSPETRVLSIGSSEQYGTQKDPAASLTEGKPLNPTSPYAVARCAQEWLAGVSRTWLSVSPLASRPTASGSGRRPTQGPLQDPTRSRLKPNTCASRKGPHTSV